MNNDAELMTAIAALDRLDSVLPPFDPSILDRLDYELPDFDVAALDRLIAQWER